MRDYPNMSYCMFQNTVAAMDQIANFMHDADEDDVLDISSDELRAMRDMVGYCEQFLRLAEEFEEKRREAQELFKEEEDTEEF